MKYFVVSDIHGHLDVLIESLLEKEWDMMNNKHKLIIVGDLVDRGPQNKELLEFVYDLWKNDKVELVIGNHDVFLLDFFEGRFDRLLFNIERNGHGETLAQMLGHRINEQSDLEKERQIMIERYPHIYKMLLKMDYYIEKGNYIFVHGGINPSLPNWRFDTLRNFTWQKQSELPKIPGKTIVCGHQQNVYIADPENYRTYLANSELYPEKFDIIHNEGVIHIDGSVVRTKKVNVLVLDI